MNQDEQHLDLLKIFYFVFAGLQAFGGCVPVIHLSLGVAMLSGKLNGHGGEGPPEALGWFFVVMALGLMALFWTLAGLTFTAGQRLGQRRSYTFCFVIAALLCIFMPLGTILGVFTILVLQRPPVKALFGA